MRTAKEEKPETEPAVDKKCEKVASADVCKDTSDIYDLGAADFGPEQKKAKRRKPRKKRGDIILTFGQQREKVAPILKQLKNLKTPQTRKPLATLNKDPPPPPPGLNDTNDEVFHPPSAQTIKNPAPPKVIVSKPLSATAQSSPGFSRDCDDFLPSYDHPMTPEHAHEEEEHVLSHNVPDNHGTKRQLLSSNQHLKTYKTPSVPRHIGKKKEGKVRT